jgi:hypothetical protein
MAERAAKAMADAIDDSSQLLGCGSNPDAPGCEVLVRRQIDKARAQVLFERRLRGFEDGYRPE